MTSIGQFTSKALLPSQVEQTQETQNQTIAQLQAQLTALQDVVNKSNTVTTETSTATATEDTTDTKAKK